MALSLAFTAYKRHFHLHLVRDTETFTPDFTAVDETHQRIDYDLAKVYRGYLKGEKNSAVYGVLNNGVFYGKIYHNDEEYYLDPAEHYFKKVPFHSVIYKGSDIHYKHQGGNATCGHNNWRLVHPDYQLWHHGIMSKSSRTESISASSANRKKRNVLNSNADSCQIQMDADPYFTQQYGGRIQAVDRLVLHAQAADLMYRRTDLDGDGVTDNARIKVKKMRIYTTVDKNNVLHNNNLGVNALLKLYSQNNYNEFCTSFLFTYRTFQNGVLGLAYIGSICNIYAFTAANTQQSTNCGLVTTQNSGEAVPLRASEVTFAHELGHNFGAQHDNTYTTQKSCYPGGLDGNYIMYAYATTGNLKNNNFFSSCSRTAMTNVLRVKAASCFKASTASICGNGIVETGEDCDCGAHCDIDKCCNPAGSTNQCKYATNAQCSISNGPCCNNATCQIRPASDSFVCRTETDCASISRCSGSVNCPAPTNKPDRTRCNKNQKLCSNGECTLSLCELQNMAECKCSSSSEACHLCCQSKSGGTCISTYTMTTLFNKTNVPPGTSCANMTGYCDIFSNCRQVNEAGPLSTLLNITTQQVLDWAARNWWIILLVCCSVVLGFAIFIRFVAPLIPSDNPGRIEPIACGCCGCSNQRKKKNPVAIADDNINDQRV
ncbi:uncharacterized protein TRIADDRAFT_52298 [Trichoplax adhaerens]|uniref:ADAM10 endopeptidase n=1 Tax=Trichoplax adhaerens TaxID=10228 RepID=B3RMA9_TRIAD|nr:hypothetical protein TRIADDRAFT_52298 [Trichoplax adhaerens]EDV28932.1 hypothetical protein TRIADDRAFT_52298 [Trichoplax adhaerens]|eukprot:XP_002108134.1 hypothetical protein TRIADDRAFT_52298 [Trichoplax adhaerens]